MLAQKYKDMLGGKSVIRELSEFATARGKEIGYENVFDYSLGNPSAPAPASFTEEMIRLLQEEDAMQEMKSAFCSPSFLIFAMSTSTHSLFTNFLITTLVK